MVRVLKVGGKLIVVVPAEKSEKWLLKLRPTYFAEIHHVRVFRIGQLEDTLLKYKFKLIRKKRKGFLQHIEFYYLFKNVKNSKGQLSIGNWRENNVTKLLHIGMIFLDPTILHVPLQLLPKWFWLPLPVWVIAFPFGYAINTIGNRFFPKSIYYEFVKKK